eukprot:2612719-Pyramimonas_sp.AAC.1
MFWRAGSRLPIASQRPFHPSRALNKCGQLSALAAQVASPKRRRHPDPRTRARHPLNDAPDRRKANKTVSE